MKSCPKCSRVYADDALNFCLDDGEWLVAQNAVEEPVTAILSGEQTDEGGTRTQPDTSVAEKAETNNLKIGGTVSRPSRYRWAWIATVAVAIAAAALGTYKFIYRSVEARPVSFENAKLTRLTTTGKVRIGAIAPDGKFVAHVIDDAGRQALWVRQIVTQSNVLIVQPTDVQYIGLAFSPDGNYVYFTSVEKGGLLGTLYQVPSLGGSARKILADVAGPISFSPDGNEFAYLSYSFNDAEDMLMIANADGSRARKIAGRRGDQQFYRGNGSAVSWSPDGKTIASPVGNLSPENYMTVATVSVDTGELKFFTQQKWAVVAQVAWLADGGGMLLIATDNLEVLQVWQLSYPRGTARRVTNDLNNYLGISLDVRSDAMVTVQAERQAAIWVAPVNDAMRAKQITSGRHDDAPSWTPDGRVVYSSDAGGNQNLYLTDSAGGTAQQLTASPDGNISPSVSPDGRSIAFVSSRSGDHHIWLMNSDGSKPQQLTDKFDFAPQWTADGQWIVYMSFGNNQTTVWRVSVNGGPPLQISDSEKLALMPTVSPDGKEIACNYTEGADQSFKLAILPIEGGQPMKTFPGGVGEEKQTNLRWTADGRSVIFVDTRGGVSNLWAQPLDGSPAKQLTSFANDIIFAFDFSRDGKQIAVSRGTRSSDVVLIKDFR